MRLTAFTDFGFRTLMRLAGEPDKILTTEAIAREFSISRNHLNKVVQNLAAAGLVRTVRGAHGGLRLARPAAEINLGDVVRHLELGQALVECFRNDGGACVLTPRCLLKSRLAAATRAFLAELDRSTLADVAYPPPPRQAA
jgi:Rrf2 family transcriptional regulator, nitric oxide-sensitive transcriptional repressor